MQNWGLFWYFQVKDLVANVYFYMSTKSYSLIPYNLQDHNIQSQKIKIKIPLYLRDIIVFWRPKKLFF